MLGAQREDVRTERHPDETARDPRTDREHRKRAADDNERNRLRLDQRFDQAGSARVQSLHVVDRDDSPSVRRYDRA